MEFLSACCNVDHKERANNMFFTIAVAIKMIRFIRNLNLILPYCFLINLLQSFISGSKKVSSLNSKVTPGAGHTTYKKIECPLDDTVLYFYNIGKYVIKIYCMTSQKTKKVAIIISTLHLNLGDKMMQKIPFLNFLERKNCTRK